VEPRERFAKNLRALRLEQGWSQEALAAACDPHRTEVSLLERAARDPRLATIVRLARALGVRPAELLDGIK
jgi:transcriptional regulator with XRE-family HTH domain